MSEAPDPRIRASDVERERTAQVVRRAVGDGRLTLVEGDERLAGVYASVYRGELEPWIADLGETVPGPSPVASTPAQDPTIVAGGVAARSPRATSVAVMSGVRRAGEWSPGASHRVLALMGGAELVLTRASLDPAGVTIDVVAVMGGAQIDLRGAPIGPGGLTVRVFALMGGAEVTVDARTRVEENGLGIMGAFVDETGAPTEAGGPVVRVTGAVVMGGVNIKRRAATDRAIEGS